MAPCLAVFGTASEVGKSITATAMCRILAKLGLRVAPFKAQNMSNNSGVTPEGGEMGRAQVVQAEAAGISPHVDMNPILLKPSSDTGSQVVVLGEVFGNREASAYHQDKMFLFKTACQALDRLREAYDLVIMEGAGSCAEVNLASHDIVNFRMAEYAGAPVILVADIHRGGIFAQCVGTLECLPPGRQDKIIGFLINRFRGEANLFMDGIRWIEVKTGKPVLGLVPWYRDIHIEAEDSVVIENPVDPPTPKADECAIAIIRLPHISNFTDFDPLLRVKDLTISFLEKATDLSCYRAVILPGSKNTLSDLGWLVSSGWAEVLTSYKENGGYLLGICGGYQMLGHNIGDPEGLEGRPGSTTGLKFLPVETTLTAPKTTTRTRFFCEGVEGEGYEIHMGKTTLLGGNPLFKILSRNGTACSDSDGCVSPDGNVLGTYVHGLFDNPQALRQWLSGVGLEGLEVDEQYGLRFRDQQYDLLAQHFLRHLELEPIIKAVGIEQ
ncbi:MAG: cobyric acid synthase CobQ [Desulfobacterales bacterium C00003060]|nr:MAG: cobyric acid synthase CobQ [Desulfobacterales bacterium S3730MH5]OEU80330.1 MAG: cobyric acid synthase CobQ [Desulfobacterales bacterium C00003060]OEU84014.1 MAG: cobyric acid synthase CobQ [Desulfobacterales bacterium S5133MH4]